MSSFALPTWLLESLPEHKPHITLSWDAKKEIFVNDVTSNTFASLVEAYDWAEQLPNYQVVIDSSVDGHGGELFANAFFCHAENPEADSARLLIFITSENQVADLESQYQHWLSVMHPKYENDPDNWVIAFAWLRLHPMSWFKNSSEPNFVWSTEDGLDHLRVEVWSENNMPRVRFEFGGHVPPSFTRHYGDDRLSVEASSMEEAYIKLAKQVNKQFFPDGSDRISDV